MYLLTKENDILSIRDQYALCDEILKNRLEELMPQLLKECGVDMWLVICREYNEDPVFKTLTPPAGEKRFPHQLLYLLPGQPRGI